MNLRTPILFLGLVVVGVSCSRNTTPEKVATETGPGPILAVVGTEQLTLAEFEAELARRAHGLPGAAATTEQRTRLLDEMIRLKAGLAKARAHGQEREPATRALIEKLIAAQYVEAEFSKWAATNAPVTDAEIRAFYDNHPEQFQEAAAVRAGVIRFNISSKAEASQRAALREQAAAIRAQAAQVDEAGFRRLVQQHSEDQATRYAGGDTGWLPADEPSSHWPPAVVTAACALPQAGDVAPLVATAEGFFVVRLVERRPAQRRPLATVQEAVRYQLQQTRRQQLEAAFTAELKRDLRIEVNQSLLTPRPNPAATAQATPPPVPGS